MRASARGGLAMNFYVKKLCVLKQISSGFAADGKKVSALITCETYAGKLTANLSLINFAPLSEGRYRAALVDEHGTAEIFDIDGPNGCTIKRQSALNIAEGFSCTVVFSAGSAKAVAFGKCGEKVYDVKKIAAMVGRQDQPPKAGGEESAAAKPSGRSAEGYDDEIVASENYYEFPDADMENLTIKGEKDGGKGNSAPKRDGQNGQDLGKDEDAQSLFRIAGAENIGEDERACYYEKVKRELCTLFSKYPREEALCRLLPESDWVRIDFGKNKFYVVGVIREGKKPKYICYGVPAEKRSEPPDALKGYCSFLPASLFDLDGKGYWMMYQDAETGKNVRLSQQ